MKKYIALIVLPAIYMAMAAAMAEEPQSVPIQRFVDTGSVVKPIPRVTVLANDPLLLQRVDSVQRRALIPLPLTSSTQQSPGANVQVLQVDPAAVSSTVVNDTNGFLFHNITTPDIGMTQGSVRSSSSERLQQVELFRRQIANQKRAAQ